MIYASYHSRLEISFFLDEYLKPPQKEEIEFADEKSPKKKHNKENGSKSNSAHHSRVSSLEKNELPSNSKVSHDNATFYLGDVENERVKKDTTQVAEKGASRKERAASFVQYSSANDAHSATNIEKNSNTHETKPTLSSSMGSQECKSKDNALIAVNQQQGTSTSSVQNVGKPKNNDQSATKAQLDSSNAKTGVQSAAQHQIASQNPNLLQTSQSSPDMRLRHPSGGHRDRSPNTSRKSAATQLTDHSDPLHNYQKNKDDSIFHSSMDFQEQQVTHRYDQKSLMPSTTCLSDHLKCRKLLNVIMHNVICANQKTKSFVCRWLRAQSCNV